MDVIKYCHVICRTAGYSQPDEKKVLKYSYYAWVAVKIVGLMKNILSYFIKAVTQPLP